MGRHYEFFLNFRYNVGTEHTFGEDVSKNQAILSEAGLRLPGGGHEVGR